MRNKHFKRAKDSSDDSNKSLVYRIGRKIYFYDDVDAGSVCQAIKYIDEIEKESKKPIEFEIMSYGGSCYDGLALYDRIRRSQCEIFTIATGMVGSMAVIVYLAGDYRYITENCTILNHQSSDAIEGKASDLKINVEETIKLEELMVDIIAERTGLLAKKIKAEIKIGDDYIRPEQAIEDGFAHELIANKRSRRRRKRTQSQ